MNTTVSRILDVLKYVGRKFQIRSLRIKHYVGIAGVCLAIAGWVLSNADRFPLVYRIVAPKYLASASALEKMKDKDFVLKGRGEGFAEISEIIKDYFEVTISREVTQMKTLSSGTDMLDTAGGKQWEEYVEIETSFLNEPPVTGKFFGLKAKIEQKYLTSKLMDSKDGIFWVGVLVIVIALFL